MRILVTGATGFVGWNLCQKLEENALFTTVRKDENAIQNEGVVYAGDSFSEIPADYYDFVIHLAANNDTMSSDRDEMFVTNVYEPIAMFHKLKDAGCRRFIYASSTAVYGHASEPLSEETPTNPLNIYAESKLEFDRFAMDFGKRHDVSVVGLRFCNMFGPGEGHKGKRRSMISQMVSAAKFKWPIQLFKEGEQRRDWLAVEDAVEAILLSTGLYTTDIFNIGSGYSTSFLELVEMIRLFADLEVEWVDCPFPFQYQEYTECNIEKAQSRMYFEPSKLHSGHIKALLDY